MPYETEGIRELKRKLRRRKPITTDEVVAAFPEMLEGSHYNRNSEGEVVSVSLPDITRLQQMLRLIRKAKAKRLYIDTDVEKEKPPER